MSATTTHLEQWQERLERHFESLVRIRAGSEYRIFALEHSLNDGEIEEVSSLLHSCLKARTPLSRHWLPWVIYASERGYTYEGDEYWGSFEEHMPQWETEDRYKLRRCFKKFQEMYDGVVPSGRWANHFTIISWPITHAILPRYLQLQFAKALYDLRYRLVGLGTLAPATIGRLLSANAHHASTRFQEFLQQEELTGRIVLALLDTTPVGGKDPIYPRTLQRIVKDLEKVRRTREWFGETRRYVRDRFKGIGSRQPARGLSIQRGSSAVPDEVRFSARPSIVLGHRGGGIWSVRLEIPSFHNVATLSTDIRSFLRSTRCRLNGADDIKPAGWLLARNRKGVLRSWPDSQKPLIQFDQSHGEIDHLLESECRLTPGPVWLFRIAEDGTAREITSCTVRPGYSYIVVTTAELPEPYNGMSVCSVNCTGVKSFRLQIPSSVSAEDTAWLNKLCLQVARTIHVWPAGLPGRGWDGEGSSEWLTTEEPCFGFMHDHPVDAYSLCVSNGTQTVVEAGPKGEPIFVSLSSLPAGEHTLTVKAQRSSSLNEVVSTPAAEGFAQLHVREPEPWTPGAVSHTGFIVTLEPHDARLDIFWRNEVKLSVLGPEGRSVALAVSLKDRNGNEILSKHVENMELPITPEAWSNRFSQFIENEKNGWSYLEAATGQLKIKGEELGEFSCLFEHDSVPLRWVLSRDRNDIRIRLIDDTGQEESEPEFLFFSMESPLKAKPYPSGQALSGMIVEPPGGLFYAKLRDYSDIVIVSAIPRNEGLHGLGITPRFFGVRTGSIALGYCLRMFVRWYEGRSYGPLVKVRRKQIADGYLDCMYETLCGQDWTRAEKDFLKTPNSQHSLDALQQALEKKSTGFSDILLCEYKKINESLDQAEQWYSDLAVQYHVSTDLKLCDFAFKLATKPHLLSNMSSSEQDGMLNAIRDNPAILRGARFLALLYPNQNHG